MVGVCCTGTGDAQLWGAEKHPQTHSGGLLINIQRKSEGQKEKKNKTRNPFFEISKRHKSPGVIYGCTEKEH